MGPGESLRRNGNGSNESTDNESTDDDDVDERDLDSYTCRQTFNDARAVLDRSSNLAAKSTTSTIPSATTVSTKRKSTTNQSNANKLLVRIVSL
mgnify:CR=1 FL=1